MKTNASEPRVNVCQWSVDTQRAAVRSIDWLDGSHMIAINRTAITSIFAHPLAAPHICRFFGSCVHKCLQQWLGSSVISSCTYPSLYVL